MASSPQLDGVRMLRPAAVREMAALASAALRYPLSVTSAADAGLVRLVTPPSGGRAILTPVVLIHGYGGNRSNWLCIERELTRVGFANLHAMLYNPLTTTVPRLAQRLVEECTSAMCAAQSDRVHVVGHSLGGVVLRLAAARLGLAQHLDTGVTIASPHGGTPVARLGRGPVAAALRPGSQLLRSLRREGIGPHSAWVSYWSDCDPIVRPGSAWLPDSGGNVVNVKVSREGHLSILRSTVLRDDLSARLLYRERPLAPTHLVAPGFAVSARAAASSAA